MKTLKFRRALADMILAGEKVSTWRLFDDKDLSEGDEVELLVWETKELFANARLTKVISKPLGSLTEEDKVGHETFDSDAEMYKTYSGYYGADVDSETEVKIIWFELL